MGNALTDVMVHVNEYMDEAAMQRIEQELRKNKGVVSVGHRPGDSHLLMVVYDSDVAPAASLLRRFAARGLHAQVVGM